MTSYHIARLYPTEADMAALLAVERVVLGDVPYDAVTALGIATRPEHCCYVACGDHEIVGFCSCFETNVGGARRLEIDLLGVSPAHRQQGLATALIRVAMNEARGRGTRLARGVVAVDNVASRRAFERAGLVVSTTAHMLLVHSISDDSEPPAMPDNWVWQLQRDDQELTACEFHSISRPAGEMLATAHCLLVVTLSYRGLWIESLQARAPGIEGVLAQEMLAAMLAWHGHRQGMTRVGYLAPAAHSRAGLVALVARGYAPIGRYVVFEVEKP